MSSTASEFIDSTHIACIGGGNMARSLIGGLLRSGTQAARIRVSEPNAVLGAALARDFSVQVDADNLIAASGADIWIVAVKPQVMRSVCVELADIAKNNSPLVISIAAGIRATQIDAWLGGCTAVVRCMPNTPALIGAGASGLFANLKVSPAQREQAERILRAVGIVVWIDDEELMDTVTALSGSGPAYFFLLAEALEAAAVAQGLPAHSARALAAQTCLGAGRMLREDGATAAELRARVTSPGGTTQAALQSFARDDFTQVVADAVAAATARGREMSRELDG